MSESLQWMAFIFMAVCTIWGVVALVGAYVAWRQMKRAIDRLTGRLEPSLKRLEEITGKLNETVGYVSERARGIADKAEFTAETAREAVEHVGSQARAIADDLSSKTRSTASLLRDTIASPVISLASLWAGIKRGLEVWGASKTRD
jgi:predicted PurR-regulated permease PerM